MRALGASERVMDIITSAEVPTATVSDTTDGAASVNLEIAGGKALPRRVAGRVVFQVSLLSSVSLCDDFFFFSVSQSATRFLSIWDGEPKQTLGLPTSFGRKNGFM